MNYLNLTENEVQPIVTELNVLLADYHLYYQKLRNFHWNVTGENFFDLHVKFEELYTDARVKIDEIAERILTLRYHPISNYSEFLAKSSINESPVHLNDHKMVEELLFAHGILLKQMAKVITTAEKVEDEGTIDLVGAYIRELEKSSWMLNAWSKKNSEKLQFANPS
ncbi:Non-specific DNA-binding protein Dps / Iron-binding ferritin-like antioxidant protein / Ferroxidase [Croceitalea dokdonensis DOKDO 023]|uniref:Non-specific DNA-binding protein Dps / Iron-binding ferritin-like antioxidant protein / Ferroxidase n=1 Tax=Croceitalea dokdonensis DOKDO 023 TaxID=1300341 RepID=A0A0P7B484_9FLAO|nr:DNA starvation/stationary phase protection protein [Croceitalea dokdonensis]KPM33503.1 Non-specific DNA-binding protein Dps / Iron-binding ferritin-like antioxidant protein / Ferroxidase [Croceitalea dokdonensis DOKDO 023]